MNTNEIAALIEASATKVLNDWTAEAVAAGADIDSYIGDKLDAIEDTEPEVSLAVGAAHLRRLVAMIRRATEMTHTETIERAATTQTNASHDYTVLRQEAVRLARRILAELDDAGPVHPNWGHVGDIADARDELRAISDRMFTEGEYAE